MSFNTTGVRSHCIRKKLLRRRTLLGRPTTMMASDMTLNETCQLKYLTNHSLGSVTLLAIWNAIHFILTIIDNILFTFVLTFYEPTLMKT